MWPCRDWAVTSPSRDWAVIIGPGAVTTVVTVSSRWAHCELTVTIFFSWACMHACIHTYIYIYYSIYYSNSAVSKSLLSVPIFRKLSIVTFHCSPACLYPNIVLLGLYSLSGKTYHRQISWSLEAVRMDVIMVVSLWNVTGISAALLPRCLSNFRSIGKV